MDNEKKRSGWWPLIGTAAITLTALLGLYSWAYYAHVHALALEVNDDEGPRVVDAMYFNLPDFCDGHTRQVDLFFAPMLAIDKLIRPKVWEER